jgi:glycolate oxidase FAD binding subunit
VAADVTLSMANLRRILRYEPNDLTVSVEAGMPFAELQAVLAERGQMIALDPPFWSQATVGGVVASNSNGPMRRGFGTARDLIIGMEFATLEGKLVKTGGMVVKNVAGLDMMKLMVGSFGTLAALTSINFRVHSLPKETRSFLFTFRDLETAIEKRSSILRSALQPFAIDLLSPAASARFDRRGHLLAVRAAGDRAVLDRYERELPGAETIYGPSEGWFWEQIREFAPDFLMRQPGGMVLRISTPLADLGALLKLVTGPSVSRAGSGVSLVGVSSWPSAQSFFKAAAINRWSALVEYAPDAIRSNKELWPPEAEDSKKSAFAIMNEVKRMFDPHNLLNRSRLYGRI